MYSGSNHSDNSMDESKQNGCDLREVKDYNGSGFYAFSIGLIQHLKNSQGTEFYNNFFEKFNKFLGKNVEIILEIAKKSVKNIDFRIDASNYKNIAMEFLKKRVDDFTIEGNRNSNIELFGYFNQFLKDIVIESHLNLLDKEVDAIQKEDGLDHLKYLKLADNVWLKECVREFKLYHSISAEEIPGPDSIRLDKITFLNVILHAQSFKACSLEEEVAVGLYVMHMVCHPSIQAVYQGVTTLNALAIALKNEDEKVINETLPSIWSAYQAARLKSKALYRAAFRFDSAVADFIRSHFKCSTLFSKEILEILTADLGVSVHVFEDDDALETGSDIILRRREETKWYALLPASRLDKSVVNTSTLSNDPGADQVGSFEIDRGDIPDLRLDAQFSQFYEPNNIFEPGFYVADEDTRSKRFFSPCCGLKALAWLAFGAAQSAALYYSGALKEIPNAVQYLEKIDDVTTIAVATPIITIAETAIWYGIVKPISSCIIRKCHTVSDVNFSTLEKYGPVEVPLNEVHDDDFGFVPGAGPSQGGVWGRRRGYNPVENSTMIKDEDVEQGHRRSSSFTSCGSPHN